VGLYFAVIHKATISHFTVTKTIRMTFANPFYKRTKQGRVENKPSPLWAGLLAMHPHGLPKYCAALGAVFNTAVSEVLQRIYQKKKSISYGCQMKLCAVCCQMFIRMNKTNSL